MSTNLGKSEVPAATRATRPGWRDARLWIGIALVAASVLVGARLLGGADDTVEVWAAARDLPAGVPITEDDLVVHRVRFEDGEDRYLEVGDDLGDDQVLLRALGEGELLPAAALGEPDQELQEVPFAVAGTAVPPSVDAGSVVDVWIITSGNGGADKGEARRVLDDVLVVAAPRADDSFGPSTERQIVVGVSEDAQQVGQLLAAADGIAVTSKG